MNYSDILGERVGATDVGQRASFLPGARANQAGWSAQGLKLEYAERACDPFAGEPLVLRPPQATHDLS
jgi:hypothetical protein